MTTHTNQKKTTNYGCMDRFCEIFCFLMYMEIVEDLYE